MRRISFAGLQLQWDIGDLPLDPFAAVMPLSIEPSGAVTTGAADLAITATLVSSRTPSPGRQGAEPTFHHGTTRVFAAGDELVLWDGASTLRITRDGSCIEAEVHPSSIERPFHFCSVTATMAIFLALRARGLFHLHAGAAQWHDGSTWLLPGESGSGKSTLSLALFAAGARWMSDDAVLLRSLPAGCEVVGWARLIRLTERTASGFPALRALLTRCPPQSAREWELDPRLAFADRGVVRAGPPHMLVFPRLADAADSSVRGLDAGEAMGRTLQACAWVAQEHVPRRREQLDLVARLVDAAPAFDLAIGRRLLEQPESEVARLRQLIG